VEVGIPEKPSPDGQDVSRFPVRGLTKFLAGLLIFPVAAMLAMRVSYSWFNFLSLVVVYILLVVPAYLNAVLRMTFRPILAGTATVTFYVLLLLCWGLWGASRDNLPNNYLTESLSAGLVGGLIAVVGILYRKIAWIFVAVPRLAVARARILLTARIKRNK